MTAQKKTSKPKASAATLRSTSGAGFDFEDLISAWLQVKMLTGEPAPAIGGAGVQLQAQVSTLGWRFDDLLLTTQSYHDAPCRLAISAKGNLQVSASGLPADFVTRAWEQWRDPQSLMSKAGDGLALVTLGAHPVFDPSWREVKNACTGSDTALVVSRIRSNSNQTRVFDSVQKPDKDGPAASAEETIELIRRLHVLPVDLQQPVSQTKNQAIAQCRQLLTSADLTEAEKLWNKLVYIASDVRLRRGTITLHELWSALRKEFDLRHHPDFERDWETLLSITSDYKAQIETELPSGYSVPRTEEKSKFESALYAKAVTVVFGESGSGKSALVKDVLDGQFGAWTQVWLGPDELKTALSAARRRALPLRHELAPVLNATTKLKNVLVIDAAERIEPAEFGVIRHLFQAVLAPPHDRPWHVVIITQTQSWVDGVGAMLGSHQAAFVELEPLDSSDVKMALSASPLLGWLTAHDDTVAALTNLRTLAWVIQAGASLGSNVNGLSSHAAIADHLWHYWTQGRADIQAFMMRLGEREASFERSFALTGLTPADVTTFTQRPPELPLHLNRRTNRIEFQHDLAADWARFQFLKQIWPHTSQWAGFAENPLWANALRMLGQFLLRQPAEHSTAWDTAFETAEKASFRLAGDILLDALCLDPEAERLLSERINLLLAGGAEHFTRLLTRFHQIGTVPTEGISTAPASLSLYIEAQYRSMVIGRWFPVLGFLTGQREKLRGLVSPALAKIIQTWLTGTPRTLENGMLVPFRRELAEMALSMARTVQVEKGHGVIYLNREMLLYTAPLASAADLPDEVSGWALELAGRRKVAGEVTARIAEVRRQQAVQHAERLRTDPQYKARHEAKRRLPASIGSYRERLPPWPLGAKRRVDMDFRTACFKEHGLSPLMRACPETAAEVLLALIIEDQPEREYGSSRYEIDLGLDYAQDGYPTAFWKSPFFVFLQVAPDAALRAIIALINFCTERWIAEIMKGHDGPAPGLTLQLRTGKEKTFAGWPDVFDWTQTNSNHNGNLFSALDALERWLTLQLDAGVDIAPYIEQILGEGASAALIGLLVNVGKYRPSLFLDGLSPLLTDPHAFFWDSDRVKHIDYKFIGWSWLQGGEAMFEFARGWILAPHRQKTFLDIVVELLTTNTDVSARLQKLIPAWSLPEDPKEALEFRFLFAMLNRDNYRPTIGREIGNEVLVFNCPNDLSFEIQSWQSEAQKPLQYLLMPEHCEKLIRAQRAVSDSDAVRLYDLLKECETGGEEDEDSKAKCRLALAATLIVLADSWLAQSPGAKEDVLSIIRTGVREAASTPQEIRHNRVGSVRGELKFAAYGAVHLWIKNDEHCFEWEGAVLRFLTSGDDQAAGAIVSVAYAYRQRLGSAWWRLLQVGLLWSGLVVLSPHHEDCEGVDRAWNIWLAKLRRLSLRGKDATADDLKMARIAAGCERLDFDRRMRAFASGHQLWRGKPKRRIGMSLDGRFLEHLFHWLLNGPGTGDWTEDANLVGRLWTYDAGRAKKRAKEDNGEYDLPSQNLGYDTLVKLANLSLTAPEAKARAVWETVLAHGPEAHYAIQHFIKSLFLHLSKGANPVAFERIWRAMSEYALDADWAKKGLWFYGERLICDLLGFGNETALQQTEPGALLRMQAAYEGWAKLHLARDEECVTRFSYFLATECGAPLRLAGLQWIAEMLKVNNPSGGWYRDGTGDALIQLVNTSLGLNAQALAEDSQARQALLDIVAALATKNTPPVLALQERIKKLR